MAIAPRKAPGTDISALVSARDLATRQARRQSEVAARNRRTKAAAELARRDDRVSIARDGDCVRISIAPKFLTDKLKEQLGWGFGFAFFNPGVFIVMAIAAILNFQDVAPGPNAGLSLAIWVFLLTLSNVVFALATRRRLTLDITNTGYYALYEKSPKRPLLFGQVSEFEAKIDTPDRARLGEARFGDSHGQIDVDKLSPRDLETLDQALLR